jgi:uncharacterized protein (DUF342 family)
MYLLEFREDGVYFKLTSKSSDLTESDKRKIIQRLKRKNLEGLQLNALLQTIYKSDTQDVKIANAQPNVAVDEEITIRVSNDEMQAFITFLPPEGGKSLCQQDILRILESYSIVYGIKYDHLNQLVSKKPYEQEIMIAQGTLPQNGQDAALKFHIELNKKATPKIYEDGQIDYRILDTIENVTKGQLLVSMIPPTMGVSGFTVSNKEIPAKPGKSINLPKGKNTEITVDKIGLLASIDGKAELLDKKVHVFSLHEVKESVDNSTGNIDFVGNVVINGNVLSGFEVRAGGFIEVKGVVEGATLISGGNVVLKRGMQGMGKGTINSGGNVVARFIESGNVSSKGDVIAEAIMHSNVHCGGKIKVAGKKGLLVGGKLHAGQGISAFTIGSPMATQTELEVGVDPEIRKEYDILKKDLDSMENDIKKAEQVLTLLGKMEVSGQPLPIDKQLLKVKARNTINALNSKQEETKIRIFELEETILSVAESKVSASKTVYPGVTVAIGTSSIRVKDIVEFVTFKREYGEVRITPYQTI